eukprot:CAMPEP_0171586714 /NCGR_PEP_ID=MMETSP0961-20121227/12770_1 /TAXON_ID=87120 /ORGANISM="Aurantiochytrium limacinum, Strain ATCCMYA-1381" /LENGTH=32 /DNA_ID= /DNA_START= /DNA_END= /DNA_ORIENTATION=
MTEAAAASADGWLAGCPAARPPEHLCPATAEA